MKQTNERAFESFVETILQQRGWQSGKREAFRDKLFEYVKVYSFLSQIVPYADPDLEMLYSYGRFLLPHLPFDRDATIVKVGDEVALQ